MAATRSSTFERGLVVNQVLPQEIVGALLQGKQGRFSGQAGITRAALSTGGRAKPNSYQ